MSELKITPEQRILLEERAKALRKRVYDSDAGTMHPLWDEIFDLEAFLQGKPEMIAMTAQQWIEHTEGFV